jgi:hypothetical protein
MKFKFDVMVHLYLRENSDEGKKEKEKQKKKKKKSYLHAVVSCEDLDNPIYVLLEKTGCYKRYEN